MVLLSDRGGCRPRPVTSQAVSGRFAAKAPRIGMVVWRRLVIGSEAISGAGARRRWGYPPTAGVAGSNPIASSHTAREASRLMPASRRSATQAGPGEVAPPSIAAMP